MIVGGGIAGLTVGYRLRDRDILLLEKEDVCGGRTISCKLGEYVFNAGAQVITGDKNLVTRLADELGVQRTLIAKSKTPIHMKGKLIAASSDVGFLWKLPLSLKQKLKFGLTVLNIKRRYGTLNKELPDLRDPKLIELNSVTLAEFVGASHPDLKAIWDVLSLLSTTVHFDEVAAYHPLTTFVNFMADEFYVEGGTWELTKALWKHIGHKTETSAEVQEITQQDGAVQVTYEKDGQPKMVQGRRCVVAVPGPLVLPVVKSLPSWKREALSKVDFGSMTSAAFLLSEPSERFLGDPGPRDLFLMALRPAVVERHFAVRREPREIGRAGNLYRIVAGHDDANGFGHRGFPSAGRGPGS